MSKVIPFEVHLYFDYFLKLFRCYLVLLVFLSLLLFYYKFMSFCCYFFFKLFHVK